MDPPDKNASHHHHHEMSLRAPLVIGANNSNKQSSSSIRDNPLPIHLLCRMFVASDVLQLSPETRFTAIVLLYRYAIAITTMASTTATHVTTNSTANADSNEDKDNDDDWPFVAGACLFLACKAEEQHRRLRDIVNVIFMILTTTTSLPSQSAAAAAAAAKGSNTTVPSSNHHNHDNNKIPLFVSYQPPPLDDTYWNAKKRVIETEQAVLRWLGFDCYVSHPHRAIVQILEDDLLSQDEYDSRSNHHKRLVINTAFRRINDALFYPKALQKCSVLELACAAVELAVAEEKEEDDEKDESIMQLFAKITNKQSSWTQKYHISRDSLNACKRMLREASVLLEILAVIEEEEEEGSQTS